MILLFVGITYMVYIYDQQTSTYGGDTYLYFDIDEMMMQQKQKIPDDRRKDETAIEQKIPNHLRFFFFFGGFPLSNLDFQFPI